MRPAREESVYYVVVERLKIGRAGGVAGHGCHEFPIVVGFHNYGTIGTLICIFHFSQIQWVSTMVITCIFLFSQIHVTRKTLSIGFPKITAGFT